MKALPKLRTFHAFPNFNGSPILAHQILLSGKFYPFQFTAINQPTDPEKRLENLRFGHSRICRPRLSLLLHDGSLLSQPLH